MSLPDNLKRIRKERHISQEALAEELNVSRQAVSKWEQGICLPEAKMLLLISEKLNVSLDDARMDVGLAVDVASFFGIRQDDAWKNARMILDTVKRLWRPLAEQFGVSRASQNEMAPAFSLCEQ